MNFTEAEFNKIFNQYISKNEDYLKITSQENPTLTMLGGVAGSGKSKLVETIDNLENKLFVNGDEYRDLHPRSDEFLNDISNYAQETQLWAGKFVEALLIQASKDRKSVIVEGTFRTSENPLNTIKQAKASGYIVDMIKIVICPSQVSWISTLTRNEGLKESGKGRLVEPKYFKTMVDNLAKNVETVVNQTSSPLQIYKREIDQSKPTLVYDSNKSNNRDIKQLISNELNRTPNYKEKTFIDNNKQLHIDNFPNEKDFINNLQLDNDLEL